MAEKVTRDRPEELSLLAHRRIIGTLGLILPALVYLLAGVRPTPGLARWDLLWSVSAYYYTGAVGVFVGVLFALSLFLFSYRGYKGVKADRIVGAVGGVAALIVALFPTAAPAGQSVPAWWSEPTGSIHGAAAVLLFAAFILFSVWLFRRSDTPKRSERPPDKRRRDDICLGCGLVMIACVVWAAVAHFVVAPIFWPESIAIVAFAVSWLVKGELFDPMFHAAERRMRARASRSARRR
jgi:hypothetical protein